MSDSLHRYGCSLPDSSVRGFLQARILERVAMLSSRGSSRPGDWTCVSYVSCIGGQVLCHERHLYRKSPLSEPLTVRRLNGEAEVFTLRKYSPMNWQFVKVVSAPASLPAFSWSQGLCGSGSSWSRALHTGCVTCYQTKGHIWKNGWREGFQKAWESDVEGEIFESCGTW